MGNNIDFTPVGNWTNEYINRFIIDDQLLVVRAGKWRVKMITIISDAEFDRRGLDAPGWEESKESQQNEARGAKPFIRYEYASRLAVRARLPSTHQPLDFPFTTSVCYYLLSTQFAYFTATRSIVLTRY
ncbi:MAG: hypothetical protein Q9183_003768 [Haloplaca sp. 2 TL-2023]